MPLSLTKYMPFAFEVENPACRTGGPHLTLAGKMICGSKTPCAAISIQQFFLYPGYSENESSDKKSGGFRAEAAQVSNPWRDELSYFFNVSAHERISPYENCLPNTYTYGVIELF
jgi:hypothetical protein